MKFADAVSCSQWNYHVEVCRVILLCFSLVKMVFGFASRSNSMPTWCELQHAILRNFGGLDDVKPVEVFAKHLRQIDKDAEVCSVDMEISNTHARTHARTHAFNGPFPRLPGWASTRKAKPIWI